MQRITLRFDFLLYSLNGEVIQDQGGQDMTAGKYLGDVLQNLGNPVDNPAELYGWAQDLWNRGELTLALDKIEILDGLIKKCPVSLWQYGLN